MSNTTLNDYSYIFLYYQNNKISAIDTTKLRDIFKTKKAEIEITEKEKVKKSRIKIILIPL